MITPLVKFDTARRPFDSIVDGDLVTVELFGGKVSGARVTRRDAHNVWVSLCGLTVPQPYAIGDKLTVDPCKVIDW